MTQTMAQYLETLPVAVFDRSILTPAEKIELHRFIRNMMLENLGKGIVEFEFIKRDGSIRHAFGTRLHNLIREHVVGGEGPSGVISFWDVEIAEWRSVRVETIQAIW